MCILTELGMIVKPFLKFSWRVERNILLRTGNFAYFACFCRGIVDNFLFPVDRSCDILNFSPREKQRRPKRRKKEPPAPPHGAAGRADIILRRLPQPRFARQLPQPHHQKILRLFWGPRGGSQGDDVCLAPTRETKGERLTILRRSRGGILRN